MINWTATQATIEQKKVRTVNYISMEFLPGRFLSNNIINMGDSELVQRVLAKTGRTLSELISYEPDPGLGNGGLGRLASCLMDSLATLQYPAFGYGLRYQYGIFDQEIWNGVQIERPDCWLLNENPWQYRRDAKAANVYFGGRVIHATNSHGEDVTHLEDHEIVRALPYEIPIIGYPSSHYSVLTLKLWSTKESPRNFELQRFNSGQLGQAGENTSLTDVLYPNDNHEIGKRIRLKQEFLLVSASLQNIIHRHFRVYKDISNFADKVRIQTNDTHPALVIPELVRLLMHDHDVSWKDAWEITRTVCSYTNHTILKEALEEWNEHRLSHLLPRQFLIIQKLNAEFLKQVSNKFPNQPDKLQQLSIIEGGQVRMANLSIVGSHKVNGVSALHSSILKNFLFHDFSELYPGKFINVTNGVTQRRWLLNANPRLSEFLTKHLGNGWITNLTELRKLRDLASNPEIQKEILEIKRKNKEQLIDFLTKENPIRDPKGKITGHSHSLGPDALFDVQIKRIHEYKRQFMNLLHLIILYQELKEDPNSRKIKRMVLMGGKAAPGYDTAKRIIQLACALSRKINSDPDVNHKLAFNFIESYNVSKAQIIIPAADLSEQISTAGMEASGTGNMKFAMNGALTIGTDDGANVEMRQEVTDPWWPFLFGASTPELVEIRKNGSYNPYDIYNHNPKIRKALDFLKNDLAQNESETHSFRSLHALLLEGFYGDNPDRFFVLKDLEDYYNTQKKVEELYLTPHKWAEYAIHNIAGMGKFSTDESIHNYAKLVWEITPCPIDPEIYKTVFDEYSAILK